MSDKRHLEYPEGKVIGTVDTAKVESVRKALAGTGVPDDRIQVIVAADMEGLESPIARSDLGGFLHRLLIGDDVERLEQLRQALARGQAIVSVAVDDNDGKTNVSNILREHDGSNINYFGEWVIERLG